VVDMADDDYFQCFVLVHNNLNIPSQWF
jgi:hypothetical protein